MKHLLFFAALTLMVSCTSKPKDPIVEFEEVLGKENSALLTQLVASFENNVVGKAYFAMKPVQAYSQLLLDVGNGIRSEEMDVTPNFKSKFASSNLRSELFSILDTVIIGAKDEHGVRSITERRRYLQADGSYRILEPTFSVSDSTLSEIEIQERSLMLRNWNVDGKYLAALKSISKTNSVIAHYVETIKAEGNISTKAFCNGLTKSGLPLDGYIAKRMILCHLVLE